MAGIGTSGTYQGSSILDTLLKHKIYAGLEMMDKEDWSATTALIPWVSVASATAAGMAATLAPRVSLAMATDESVASSQFGDCSIQR